MELRHLRYFVAVAQELSFTGAARKLHLAQPSLTRQIHNLEEELGVRLFDRGRKQILLTEEGRRFLVDSQRLLALSLESVKAVQQLNRGEPTQLNIGYAFKFQRDLLPSTLRTFYQTHPGTAVNLFYMPPAEQLRALETRKLDLGFIGIRPSAASQNMAGLDWECVARDDVVVVLPSDHSLAKQSKIKITDLKSLFFVAMSEETHPGARSWLSGLCQRAGFAPRILQDVELESGMMTFVAEGLGVTLARKQIENLPHPGVVFRPLTSAAKAEYWIAWHRENHTKVLRAYIEVVKEEAARRTEIEESPVLRRHFARNGFAHNGFARNGTNAP